MSERTPPRLHAFSTIDEAAAWLSHWDCESWTTGAVISRLYAEWMPCENSVVLPLPETIAVVLPMGTNLFDRTNGTAEILSHSQIFYVCNVEVFLRQLHETGNALNTSLTNGAPHSPRWIVGGPLAQEHIRLNKRQIEGLLGPFRDLVRLIHLGHIESQVGIRSDSVDPETSNADVLPVLRSTAQEQAILNMLTNLGYEPKQLPKNEPGHRGVRAKLRESLVGRHQLFPKKGSQFTKAWERLSANGDIAYK